MLLKTAAQKMNALLELVLQGLQKQPVPQA